MGMTLATGAAGGGATASWSIRSRRWTSTISAASATAHVSSRRRSPYFFARESSALAWRIRVHGSGPASSAFA